MRLQKYMAQCGVCSRRKAEELIQAGMVTLNGETVTQMGTQVDEQKDKVTVNGEAISLAEKLEYYAFYKPTKVITTAYDEKGRKRVLDYFDGDTRLFTVGRLDYDSSGLIFVTNDGEFANKVTHPRYQCHKTYEVHAVGHISESAISQLRKGILLDDSRTAPANIASQQMSTNMTFLSITIREGKNRQIRRMIESIGASVDMLERVAVGIVTLDGLEYGAYRELTELEVQYFYSL